MATLQTENKPLDAKEIAASVMKSLEDQAVMISGNASEELVFLVRSKNITAIEARGEKFWNDQEDNLTKSFLSDVIHSLYKAKKNYLANKETQGQDDLFRTLRSRGVPSVEAEKLAYPNGIPVSRK